ncbi:MAG TPA: response regulator [Opitutaceae bacterium]
MSSPNVKSVVVVDDEQSYTDLLAQLLGENLTCPVHTFTRPLAALEALPLLDVGMIVTDYYMPQLNGIEFLHRARKLCPDVPFVMITGHMMELEADDYHEEVALKAVLAKPFSWRKLADEIIRHWPDPQPPVPRLGAASF